MSIFDTIQSSVFDTVTAVFGDKASWLPSAGGDLKEGEILYKDPSEKYSIGESDYEPGEYYMEWKRGLFEGLKEAVEGGALEVVTVTARGLSQEFYVRRCVQKFDGQTYFAILNRK